MALDLLGFASQLVFTTFCLGNFGLDQGEDMALCYAAADAHNRMLADFCRVDARLLATAYVPLEDFEHARATTAAGAARRCQGADGAVALPAAAMRPAMWRWTRCGRRRRRRASRCCSTWAARRR